MHRQCQQQLCSTCFHEAEQILSVAHTLETEKMQIFLDGTCWNCSRELAQLPFQIVCAARISSVIYWEISRRLLPPDFKIATAAHKKPLVRNLSCLVPLYFPGAGTSKYLTFFSDQDGKRIDFSKNIINNEGIYHSFMSTVL